MAGALTMEDRLEVLEWQVAELMQQRQPKPAPNRFDKRLLNNSFFSVTQRATML
jgi:hypothetical protein